MSKHQIFHPQNMIFRLKVFISYFTGKPLTDIFSPLIYIVECLEELSPFASEFLVHAADVEVCIFEQFCNPLHGRY